MTEAEVIQEIKNLANKYASIEKVLLYGSRARGTARDTSDFDLCVCGYERFEYNNFFNDIDDMDTWYTFDVVSFHQIKNKVFLNEILRDGVTIYER